MLNLIKSYFIYSGLPSNITINWNYGSILGIILMIQIMTGITLAMHYTAHIELAFISVEHIMRNVQYGWLIRYLHANGASLFFLFVYLHIGRGLYAGSYIYPRNILWNIGVIIYFIMTATAFLGYKFNSLKRNMSNNKNSTEDVHNNKFKFEHKKKYINLHLKETQLKIASENRQKSGIYLILNNINGKFYIGSASTNRINRRFRNHLILKSEGSKLLNRAVLRYGLENFTFFILEYYPGFVHKEDLKKAHLELLKRETYFINLLNPVYNILTIGSSNLGFKHRKEIIDKIKLSHNQERKNIMSLVYKGKIVSQETKDLLNTKLKIKYLESDLK